MSGERNFSALEAPGADLDGLLLFAENCLDLEEVRFPHPASGVVSVTDGVAAHGLLSANIAFPSHSMLPFTEV